MIEFGLQQAEYASSTGNKSTDNVTVHVHHQFPRRPKTDGLDKMAWVAGTAPTCQYDTALHRQCINKHHWD